MLRLAYKRNILKRDWIQRNFLSIRAQAARNSIPPVPSDDRYKKTVQWREPCPLPPSPPPPKPRDDTWLWATLAFTVCAGGFAVYAKRSPELRDWITIYAPWYDDFIAIVYEENMTHREYIVSWIEHFKNKHIEESPPPPKPVEEKPAKPCQIIEPPVVTKDICEVEKCVKEFGDDSVANFITAKDACICYNKLVQETMSNFTVQGARELPAALKKRCELIEEHVKNAEDASRQLDDLLHYMKCGGVKATKEQLDSTNLLVQDLQTRIKAARIEYQWENDKSLAFDVQWQKTMNMMEQYISENETMFTGVKYDQEKPSFNGDGDLLLYHNYRYMLKLRTELEEAAQGMTERVDRGVETLPQDEKEKKARESLIKSIYAKRKAESDKIYAKRLEDQKKENDDRSTRELQEAASRFVENSRVRLIEKEKEANAALEKMVAETVAAEKRQMKAQLDDLGVKLKIAEDKLEAKLRADRESKRSEQLWAAGASLLAATKRGCKRVNVSKELEAIENAAGDGDKLVDTVIKSIPDSVRQEGVIPESVLRNNYNSMEKTALKVALVEQEGSPLPIYFLSWIQSIFLFLKLSGMPAQEIEKPPKEPVKHLDTFDLLQRARYWIERGNIALALLYVTSLEGASRGAATTWTRQAQAHVEIRQAAEAVIAHAAALRLQYV